MFDPTLYSATLPQREIPYVHPFYAQWQTPVLPWQHQVLPWQAHQRFLPEFLPQSYFMKEPIYGTKFPQFFPFMQGLYNVPQFNRWQFPMIY